MMDHMPSKDTRGTYFMPYQPHFFMSQLPSMTGWSIEWKLGEQNVWQKPAKHLGTPLVFLDGQRMIGPCSTPQDYDHPKAWLLQLLLSVYSSDNFVAPPDGQACSHQLRIDQAYLTFPKALTTCQTVSQALRKY